MSSDFTITNDSAGTLWPLRGRYVPETLMVPLFELERAYEPRVGCAFQSRFNELLKNFAVPARTPLQFAARLTEGSVDRAFISNRRSATYRGAQITMPLARDCSQ